MYSIFNRYLSLKSLFVWFSEFLLVFAVNVTAAALRFSLDWHNVAVYDPYFMKTIVLTMVYIITFTYFDLYSSENYHPSRQMALRLIEATLVGTIALFSIFYILPQVKAWRGIFLINTIMLPLVLLGWRSLFAKRLKASLSSENVLIIGSGELAKKIGRGIYDNEEFGLKLIGFIDDDPAKMGKSVVNPGVIGGYGDISRLVQDSGIRRIIVALADRRAKLPMSALLDCKLQGITIEEGESFQEKMTGQIPVEQLKPSWMVFSDGFKSLKSRKFLKRIFDLVLAVIVFVLSLPIMAVTAALIKLESRGPVIFKQPRVGENGKEFNIYKFRSMRADAEDKTGPVWAQTNDNRITRVGSVIRKLRIDELPQLVNVLRGDMSFVGPRPERKFFVEKLKEVIPYYEMRTVVKPGITGWAQIKYPYGADFNDALEKLQYDIYYIKNMSPLLDILIFFMTLKVVISGRGAR